MIVKTFTIDAVDRIVWDSERGVVTYAADGTTETDVRPFTALEQDFVGKAVFEVGSDNTNTLTADLITSIDTMLAGIQQIRNFSNGGVLTKAQVNADPDAIMRIVAAELVEVEENLIKLVRVQTGQTESTDVGV